MTLEIIAVNLAVFAAAALQSATGIGFGIIAGPILLVVLNDSSAIQVSILLNLAIASLLTPTLWHNVDRQLLWKLVLSLVVATPFGVLLFLAMDVVLLKVVVALAVGLTLVLTLRNHRLSATTEPVRTSVAEQGLVGAIAGLMGGSLGIPGPIPAAWMSSKGYGKDAVRATILAMFVFSYGIALVLQMTMANIAADTYVTAVVLAPATLVGILTGRWLSGRLTEQTFKIVLLVVLASTIVLLLATLY